MKKEQLKELIGENYILYDIETSASDNEKIFLLCAYNSKTKKISQFFQKNNVKALLKEFEEYLSHYPGFNLISFSNCNYEKRSISLSAEKFKMKKLHSIIQNERDIGTAMTNLVIGDYDYNLKALASQFGYKWKSKLDGFEVGISYDIYLESKKAPNWKAIKSYNKEDVLALKFIIEKILAN